MSQHGQGDANRTFQLGGAKGRFLKWNVHFVRGVRRVIACNAVDGAVGKCLNDQVYIDLSAKRRKNLEPSIEFTHMVFDKGEVHRANFARHGCT